jgi:VanZ family protein
MGGIGRDKYLHFGGSVVLVVVFHCVLRLKLKVKTSLLAAMLLAFGAGLLKELLDKFSISLPGMPPCPCNSEVYDVVADACGVAVGSAAVLGGLILCKSKKEGAGLPTVAS